MKTEFIVAVAIHYQGMTFSMAKPARHCNITQWMGARGIVGEEQRNQGFLTSFGRYVGREAACRIARAAQQIGEQKRTNPQHILFSEDLW